MKIISTVSRSWPASGDVPEFTIEAGEHDIPDDDKHRVAAAQRLIDQGLARVVGDNTAPVGPPGADHPPPEATYSVDPNAPPPAARSAQMGDKNAAARERTHGDRSQGVGGAGESFTPSNPPTDVTRKR